MKSLVVFYSLTGNTRLAASKIAAMLDADLEPVLDLGSYKGFWGYMRAGYDSLRDHEASIRPPRTTPHGYDLVVAAGPIWAGRIAPPLRSYLRKFSGDFRNIAFCVTRGGSSPEKALAQMESLSGASPTAKLALTAGEIANGRDGQPVNDFVETLKEALEKSPMTDVAGS